MRATIKMKLGATFLALLLILIALASFSVTRMGTLNRTIREVIEGPVTRLSRAQTVDAAIGVVLRTEKNMAMAANIAQARVMESKLLTKRDEVGEMIAYGVDHASPDGRANWNELQQTWTQFVTVNDKLRTQVFAGEREAAFMTSSTTSRDLALKMTALTQQVVTQQNAAASEQISSTSEELAAQAEELQASIAFFRLRDEVERPLKAQRATPARKAPARTTTKQAAGRGKPATIASQQARVRGFALDLATGGPDDEDAHFGRAA